MALQAVVIESRQNALGMHFLVTILALRHRGVLSLVAECAIEFGMFGLALGQHGIDFIMTCPAVL